MQEPRYVLKSEHHTKITFAESAVHNAETLADFIKGKLAANAAHRCAIGVDQSFADADHHMVGEYTAAELRDFGKDAPSFNILAIKHNDWMSVASDIVSGFARKPWSISPTIRADLPETTLRSIAKRALAVIGPLEETISREQKMAILRAYKKIGQQEIQAAAKEGAKQLDERIYDEFQQTGWETEYKKFLSYFGLYDVAYMISPHFKAIDHMQWAGDKLQLGTRLAAGHYAILPHRVFPSSDVTDDISKCDNVICVENISMPNLYELVSNEGFDTDQVKKVIKELEGDNPTMWFDPQVNVAAPHTIKALFSSIYDDAGSIPMIRFNGKMTGTQIKRYKIESENIEKYQVYEVEAFVIGEYVLRVAVNPYPKRKRPIHSESYQRIPGKHYGKGLYTLLAEVIKDLNEIKRTLHTNMHEAAESIIEANRDRLNGKFNLDDIQPGSTVPVQSDPHYGNGSAISHRVGPNVMPTLMNFFQQTKSLADEISGIPSQLTGFASSPGANRTEGVFASGLANALKGMRERVERVDIHVIRPSIRLLAEMLMVHSNDFTIKFDPEIVVDGTQELLQRDAQNQQEGLILQTIMQATQTLGPDGQPLMPRSVWDVFIRDYLGKRGVDLRGHTPDIRAQLDLQGVATADQSDVDPTSTAAALPELDGRN